MLDALEGAGWLGYLLVLVAAAVPVVEVLVVIPVAVVAGLSPVPVGLLALVGNLSTVALVVVGGDRVLGGWRRWRARRRPPEATAGPDGAPTSTAPARGRGSRAGRLAERYGVPGLGLLSPLVTGSHVGAVAALALGASRGRVLVWMAAGLVLWSALATAAAVVGLDLLAAIRG